MNSAIYTKDKIQSKKFIIEMKYWSGGNYMFIKNKFKNFLMKIIGADAMIMLYRNI